MLSLTAWRRPIAAAMGLACSLGVLAGCSGKETTQFIAPDFVGGAVSGEPRAALVARDVLAAGGTAADAAVAGYFALSVTLPSSVGLGGGGACAVYDRRANVGEALEFPAVASGTEQNAVAIPAAPRGVFALHARYGRLPIDQLILPAERLARFGEPVSRALAEDVAFAGRAIAQIPDMRQNFVTQGRLVREGDPLTQLDLGATLGRLRQAGIGDLYTGRMARELSVAIEQSGGSLPPAALQAYVPRWRPHGGLELGVHKVVLASTDSVNGAIAGSLWRLLTDGRSYAAAAPADRPHLLADASLRAHRAVADQIRADGKVRPLGEEEAEAAMRGYDRSKADGDTAELPLSAPAHGGPGAAGIVTYDRAGQMVACSFTMNTPFGTLRKVPGLGFIVAPPPAPAGQLGPVGHALIVFNENSKNVYFTATGSGGFSATSALVRVTLDAVQAEMPLDQAVAAPRLHLGGTAHTLWYEKTLPEAVRSDLAARGYRLEEGRHFGRVQAAHCPQGLPGNPQCIRATDPRGYGLAASGG
ncbi:gamma-glutamyltranspeptidase/glutathione hydrolase [Oceanibaculum indicum]|uniref:Gamma-glutamyltranspeptidase/glutathione hydrolase n=2 Tax=Oceanibaculum indicum TaxID=526216 RepID=A0A420WRU3_9PROT|nr:gamma-glutamyltranspeptidase/glutathione hydrolase [Oceanibaculum indicum]